jgi:hypothetical protein
VMNEEQDMQVQQHLAARGIKGGIAPLTNR